MLKSFSLIMEHSKTEVFHFSRLHEVFNPSLLNLTVIRGPILLPKTSWWYLGFFFDQKLTFQHYIDFYANKVISSVKCIKMLGNSSRGINSLQKRRLYRCCILSIMLYIFLLWYYNKSLMKYHLSVLWMM